MGGGTRSVWEIVKRAHSGNLPFQSLASIHPLPDKTVPQIFGELPLPTPFHRVDLGPRSGSGLVRRLPLLLATVIRSGRDR